jgi:hypothetical protein
MVLQLCTHPAYCRADKRSALRSSFCKAHGCPDRSAHNSNAFSGADHCIAVCRTYHCRADYRNTVGRAHHGGAIYCDAIGRTHNCSSNHYYTVGCALNCNANFRRRHIRGRLR